MQDTDSTTVHITFEPPTRESPAPDESRHERRLDGVPPSVAERMITDFEEYCENRTRKTPLYRYERDGEEVVLALDLGEVVALNRVSA